MKLGRRGHANGPLPGLAVCKVASPASRRRSRMLHSVPVQVAFGRVSSVETSTHQTSKTVAAAIMVEEQRAERRVKSSAVHRPAVTALPQELRAPCQASGATEIARTTRNRPSGASFSSAFQAFSKNPGGPPSGSPDCGRTRAELAALMGETRRAGAFCARALPRRLKHAVPGGRSRSLASPLNFPVFQVAQGSNSRRPLVRS